MSATTAVNARANGGNELEDKYLGHSVLQAYVANTPQENISYLQFLYSNRDAIRKLPPYAKTWNAMQCSWSQRFLREIRKLGEAVIKKVKQEFKDVGYLQQFWSELIQHRNKLSVKNAFDNGCLDLVEIAGKSQMRGIEALYNEESSLGPSKHQETFEDAENNPFLVSKDEAEKRKRDGFHCSNCSMEINVSGPMRFCPYCGINIVLSENESSLEELDYDETDEEDVTDGEGEDKDTPPKIDKVAFRKAHDAIPDVAKLRLSTGKIVEDVLFNYVKDMDYEHHAHSYIIDCEDENIKSLFSETEWEELTLDKLNLPSLSQDIAKELARYGKNSLGELRKIATTSYLQDEVIYDVQQHYDLEWIQMSVRALVNLYENIDSSLIRNQYEDWFTVNLFGICIDMCMRNVQLNTDTKRTDAPSLASANRKNRARLNNARKLTGRKIDGIVYITKRLLEVGAIEAARSFLGESDRKYLIENFKMPKTLRDMLADHIRAVNYDDKKIKELQVFGILHLGLRVQFTRLWCAGGSITIFCKDPQLHYLDNKFSVEGIRTFLKFLAAIYRHKTIIKNNLDVLLDTRENDDSELKEDNLYNELMEVGQPSIPSSIRYFVDCWKTPRKVKPKKKRRLK